MTARLILAYGNGNGNDRTVAVYPNALQAVLAAKALAKALRPEATAWVSGRKWQYGFPGGGTIWRCFCDSELPINQTACHFCGLVRADAVVPSGGFGNETASLLHTLTVEGFALGVVGCNALECRGPTARLTPELRAALAEHKPTLLAMLGAPGGRIRSGRAVGYPDGSCRCRRGGEVARPWCDVAEPTSPEAEVTPEPDDWWAMVPKADRQALTAPTPRERCCWCGGISHHNPECLDLPRAARGKQKGNPSRRCLSDTSPIA